METQNNMQIVDEFIDPQLVLNRTDSSVSTNQEFHTLISRNPSLSIQPVLIDKFGSNSINGCDSMFKNQYLTKRSLNRFLSDETLQSGAYFEDKQPDKKLFTYKIHGRLRQFISKLDMTHRVCDIMSKILKEEEIGLSELIL